MKRKVIAIAATLIAILALLVTGCTGGLSEARAQVAALESQLANIEDQLASLQEELDVAKEQKATLEEQVAVLEAQIAATNQRIASDFVINSPTFVFDGIEESLELVETRRFDVKGYWLWEFVFHFESAHAGYGDRTGQMLAEVITPHEAIITLENCEITSAVMDEQWNMLTQRMISDLEDVTWILNSYTGEMGTRQALEDVEVTLIFNSEESRLGGFAGCNDYGVPYEIDGSNLTLTDDIIQTLVLCSEEIMEQENNFLEALKAAESYEVDGDNLTITGGGWTLEFKKQ